MDSRFSRNDLFLFSSLALLFVGLALRDGIDMALIVVGAILTVVNVATSFFVTWLSTRKES
jgi:hypothetical protein